MKIVKSYPPNIDAIKKVFEVRDTTVFAYGDTLYNPGGWKIGEDLIAHEMVHQKQQGANPALWWERYIAEPEFRLSQELPAYRRQFQVFRKSLGQYSFLEKNKRQNQFLSRVAGDLSSPLYGNIITYNEAFREIGKS